MKVKLLTKCRTLHDPMDCSLTGSAIHGIFQARVLEWVAMAFSVLACEMSAILCSLSILWHCLSLGLECKLTFSSPVATAEFFKFAAILSAALSQHHLLGFEIDQLEFYHLH